MTLAACAFLVAMSRGGVCSFLLCGESNNDNGGDGENRETEFTADSMHEHTISRQRVRNELGGHARSDKYVSFEIAAVAVAVPACAFFKKNAAFIVIVEK